MRLSNLKYQATSNGIHGNCVITTIQLKRGDKSTTVFDLDDADTALVKQLGVSLKGHEQMPEHAVLVWPHHGSLSADVQPLFNAGLKPTDIIFAANANNTYNHPRPVPIQRSIDAVGVDNTHISGAGDHIRITVDGVEPKTEQQRRADHTFIKQLTTAAENDRATAVAQHNSSRAAMKQAESTALHRILREEYDEPQTGRMPDSDDGTGEFESLAEKQSREAGDIAASHGRKGEPSIGQGVSGGTGGGGISGGGGGASTSSGSGRIGTKSVGNGVEGPGGVNGSSSGGGGSGGSGGGSSDAAAQREHSSRRPWACPHSLASAA